MIRTCFVYIVIFISVALKISYGQTDTEFWFAAPRVTTGHGTGGIPIYVRLAAGNIDAQVTISVPANPAFNTININLPANTAHEEDVSALRGFFENEPFDSVLNRGILIESTNLITAYYEVGTHFNPDIFSLKGRNALGKEFYVPFQNFFSNGNYTPQPYSSILIVATEDNTSITINPTKPAYPGRQAGVPFTITLNRGQTYAVVPDSITAGDYPRPGQLAANRLTGTHIVSNKPIAVTTSDDSVRANEANDNTCRDLIGDQLVPVDILGNKYIAMRGRLYSPDDPGDDGPMLESFYVVATAPSTEIFVDGILRTTINAGESYRHEFTAQTHFINSSKPVYVFHVAGFGCEMGGGLLPPISICTGSTEVSFTRSKDESFFLNILVRAGAEDGFVLNGNGPNTIINESIFSAIPGTDDWLAGEIELSAVGTIPVGEASLILNQKDVFHLGIINGGSASGTMYGYFSDFNLLDIKSVIADVGTDIELFCHGYPIQLLATGGTTYMWEPPDFLNDPTIPNPIALPDTTIRYTVTVSGACDMTDQASVTLVITNPLKAMFSTNQISGCSPLKITVFDHSIGVTNYSWRFGDGSTSNINMSEFDYTYINETDVPEQYRLMLVGRNPYFCVDTMFTFITVNPEVTARATANESPHEKIVEGCAPLTVNFDAEYTAKRYKDDDEETSSEGADKYLWKFGDGGASTAINPTHTFQNFSDTEVTYTVVLKASSEFGCVDYDTIYVNVQPYIKAGFGFDMPQYCSPASVMLNNTSLGTLDNVYWFVDEEPVFPTDNILNFDSDIYVVHDIRLIVENNYGCADTLDKAVTILPNIRAEFNLGQDAEGCNPHQVEFLNFSAGADKYFWEFGAGQGTSYEEEPEYLFVNNDSLNEVEFNVRLIATSDYGCKDISDTIVKVYPRTDAKFIFDYAEICAPDSVKFRNLSIGGTSFYWDFGDDSGIIETDDKEVSHFYNNDGDVPVTFDVTLIAKNNFGDGCPSVITRPITIKPEINARFKVAEPADHDIEIASGCHPLNVYFENNSTGALKYYWEFGDGGSSSATDPFRTYHNISHLEADTVNILMVAESQFGCIDTAYAEIVVFPKPLAQFDTGVSQGCAPLSISYADESIGGIEYHWSFGDGAGFVTSPGDQQHVFYNQEEDELIFSTELIVINDFTCADTIIHLVNVFPEIEAKFELSGLSGCHPFRVEIDNITSGASANNPYQWVYGDGSSSNETDATHYHIFNNPSHTDYVNYDIFLKAKSKYGCKDSLSQTITVFPKPKALYNSPGEAICSPATINFDNISLGATSYLWNFGYGNNTSTAVNPVHTFNQPYDQDIGYFVTELIATNDDGCKDTVYKTIKVYPQVIADFVTANGVYQGCHPLTLDFVNDSKGGSLYNWSFFVSGDSTYSNLPNTVTKTFLNNSYTQTIQAQVILKATSEYGCEAQRMRNVRVNPKPKADFSIDHTSACSPVNVRFENHHEGGSSFLWNFGNGTSASSVGVFYRGYRNLSQLPDTFNINLTVSNQHGCSSQASQSLVVFPEVTAEFSTISGLFAGCTPLTLQFVNESELANQYLWTFGDGTTSMHVNPTHLFVTPGYNQTDYEVNLKATSQYGCIDDITKTISVYPKPIADFFVTPYEQFFPSTEISVSNQSSAGSWLFNWDMGDGYNFSTNSRDGFNYEYEWEEGDYQTRFYDITLKTENPYCYDMITKQIMIMAPHPVVGFSPSAQGCPPFEVQFVNQTLYGMSYYWDFGDGNTSTQMSPKHIFENPGRFFVKLVVEGEGGLDSAFQTITVFHPPIADFRVEPEEVQLPYESVRMVNLSSLGAFYEWHFGDGNISFDFEPVHMYSNAGIYDVTLIVGTNTYPRCFDTMIKHNAVIAEEPCNIVFPNAFMPNASGPVGGYYVPGDPSNQVFHPLQEGIEKFEMRIYNRWGELVFRTDNINIGWDGYYKDKLVTAGVYVYKAWATCSNGKEIKLTGDVTVYR